MKIKYINPWAGLGESEYFETDVNPREYRGFLIYNRIKTRCWDIVKNGVCVAQRAGDKDNGLNNIIDEIIDGKDSESMEQRARDIIEKYKEANECQTSFTK